MNRYYIDTNILAFIIANKASISRKVQKILDDYNTKLLISSVCVHEMIHLIQIGRFIRDKKKKQSLEPSNVFSLIEEAGIEIVFVNEKHFEEYANLQLYSSHTDPNDRLIIAQAISDKIPLISSDSFFYLYENLGLQFIPNER